MLANFVRAQMEDKGFQLDAFSFSAVASAWAKIGDTAKAQATLEAMAQRHILPNQHVYGAVISACSKSNDADTAISLLERMREDGLRPNVVCFSSAMNACAKAGQAQQAEDLLLDMQRQHVQPNAFTYAALIQAYCLLDDVATAWQRLGEMEQRKLAITPQTLKPLLSAGLRLGPEAFDSIFQAIVKSQLPVDEGMRLRAFTALGSERASAIMRTAEDVAELMLLVATSNASNSRAHSVVAFAPWCLGAKRLFSRVTEAALSNSEDSTGVLTPQLSALSTSVILKVDASVVVAAGAASVHCRDLLEAAALKAVRGLTDEELYDSLGAWQEHSDVLERQRQTEAKLRGEVSNLQQEVQQLELRAANAQQDALEAEKRRLESQRRHDFRAGLAKRQLQSIQRGMKSASSLAERCRSCQRKAELLYLERDAVQKEAAVKKKTLQEAEQEARQLTEQLDSVEDHEAKSALALRELQAEQAKGGTVGTADAAALWSQRSGLRQKLRKTQEMLELRQLLLDERMLLEKRRLGSAEMLREIAELEEQADDVERNGQRTISELRTVLERLALQNEELRKAKDQAEDWLGAVWAALNQQRREQLLLHRRVKEEDTWAQRLQDRTEVLVDELQVLERETHTPRSQSSDKEVLRCALLQQRRKAQRVELSALLAQSRRLQGALREAEGQQATMREQLRPVQLMLERP
ncbi:unnamed protein product [Effrenium voratum]|nr:unnamed protein product [Effrenium voratum]